MKADRIQQGSRSWAMSIGRALMASVVLLSLLSFLLPLIRASANSGLKACCVGKAGHETGSCSTGLLQAASVESHVSLPLAQTPVAGTAKTNIFTNVRGGAGAAGHCSSHASSSNDSDEPLSSQPAAIISSQPAVIISEPASAPPATSSKSVSLNIRAVGSTCPNECGMCSVSYTRRPRPREQSAQSSAVRPQSTALIGLIVSDHLAVRELNFKWSQSPPRAPPALLV